MKRICTICARGGSQGVKNKNILSLRGKPLIAHTIGQAKASGLFDLIAVSSDSKKIRDVAQKWGADLLIERPERLATAAIGKLPVIQHAVEEAEQRTGITYDIIFDLDVTSPLRAVQDIHAAWEYFNQAKGAKNLVTAFPSRHSPYFNMLEKNTEGFAELVKPLNQPILRRQDTPDSYDMNASIYIWPRSILFQSKTAITDATVIYIMPEERSIDIDSLLDLELVRLLAKKRKDMD
ncbi:MAG: acylneuraminate cytidylyltransferase family protein [Gammaproteobacteria bacterium]|nr:acylneuraminate cytidylyltransferase family protein [Gammaproteobacteria bacterium]